jgi:hypothetical protein
MDASLLKKPKIDAYVSL